MLVNIIKYMLLVFILVNCVWYMLCDDISCFFTTVGFDDRLLSVSKWSLNAVLSLAN